MGSERHFGNNGADSKISSKCGAGKAELRYDYAGSGKGYRQSAYRRLARCPTAVQSATGWAVEVKGRDVEQIGRVYEVIKGRSNAIDSLARHI